MSSQPTQPVSFGHSVALAQRALSGALAGVLAGAGSSAEEWFALNTIAVRGETTPGEAIRQELREAPGATAGGVAATLAELADGGLVTSDPRGHADVLVLTPEGKARHAALSAKTRELTTAMLHGLDADAVAAASALLRTVTERAHAAAATGDRAE